MTEKILDTLSAFLSDTGKLFAYVQMLLWLSHAATWFNQGSDKKLIHLTWCCKTKIVPTRNSFT